jgi:hypothetical protein
MRNKENYGLIGFDALDERYGDLRAEVAASKWREPEMNAQVCELVKCKGTRDVAPVEFAAHEALDWMVMQQ